MANTKSIPPNQPPVLSPKVIAFIEYMLDADGDTVNIWREVLADAQGAIIDLVVNDGHGNLERFSMLLGDLSSFRNTLLDLQQP